ncbi:MAG: DNA-directed RNA polymerase subunit alpha [Patescibacteria group bacterium]|nr:DNA-directed RNA polymerase subunit alpha [Patescibacteria group bacterium]
MQQITLPDKIDIKDLGDNRYQAVIEPFYPGFGVTVGNSLRRVLLSSLSGSAVTAFKVEGAQHEFDSVDGIKEDLVEIMLNLKRLRLKCHNQEPVKLTLEVKGEKVVTAADIKKNSDVEIINQDLVIANLTEKNAKLNMEITVEQGMGYVTTEQKEENANLEIGNIAIDASFSPVLNVGYKIENVRVGEMTNYERLSMELVTDGTVDAKEAIAKAADVLKEHFMIFVQTPAAKTADKEKEEEDIEPVKEEKVKSSKEKKEKAKTKKSK